MRELDFERNDERINDFAFDNFSDINLTRAALCTRTLFLTSSDLIKYFHVSRLQKLSRRSPARKFLHNLISVES